MNHSSIGIANIVKVFIFVLWNLTWLAFLFPSCAQARPQSAVYVRYFSPPHGYTHGLEVRYPGAMPIAKEERLYIPAGKTSQGTASGGQHSPPQYFYPRPDRMFNEIGANYLNNFESQRTTAESLVPVGLFEGPSSTIDFQREHPGPRYDPFLRTGSLAEQIVRMLLGNGLLYFHQIPHERLVLQTNQERIENYLIPHRLGSIRFGHPFFNYNK